MIFLSASIPDQKRDKKYFNTADIVAIRDAVRALATVVIPKSYLVWGGHPAISPLIRYVMKTMNYDVQKHISLYQSEFFANKIRVDNDYFENVINIPQKQNLDESLYDMRLRMLRDNKFNAAVFIGGMEGVEIEYRLFKSIHPKAKIFPVASTGAAAKIIYDKIIYDKMEEKPDSRLLNDYAYMALFRSLFKSIIN